MRIIKNIGVLANGGDCGKVYRKVIKDDNLIESAKSLEYI